MQFLNARARKALGLSPIARNLGLGADICPEGGTNFGYITKLFLGEAGRRPVWGHRLIISFNCNVIEIASTGSGMGSPAPPSPHPYFSFPPRHHILPILF